MTTKEPKYVLIDTGKLWIRWYWGNDTLIITGTKIKGYDEDGTRIMQAIMCTVDEFLELLNLKGEGEE